MALPTVTVHARYLIAGGPAAGEVEFRLEGELLDPVDHSVIVPHAITRALVDGEVTVELTTTELQPLGVVWRVTEKIDGATAPTMRYVAIPAVDYVVELGDLAPAQPGPVRYEYALVGHSHPELGAGGGGGGDHPNLAAHDLLGLATQAELDAVAAAAAGKIPLATIGQPGGPPALGPDGKLPTSVFPPLVIGETSFVGSEAAMLGLVAQHGDVAVRTDLGGVRFILTTDNPGLLADWLELDPEAPVTSVQGQVGAVVLPEDGAPGAPSLRTLGVGANQAAAGNDPRLANQRVPTDGSVTEAKLAFAVATQAELDAAVAGLVARAGSIDQLGDVDTAATAPAAGDGFVFVAGLWLPRKRRFSGPLAQRAVLVPAPVDGDVYDATDDDGGTAYAYRAGAWVQTSAGVLETGGRQLALVEVATEYQSVAPHNVLQDLPGRSVTFVAGARPVTIVYYDPWTIGTAVGNVQTTLVRTDTGATIQQGLVAAPIAGGSGNPVAIRKTLTGLVPGQAYTVKARGKANTNNLFVVNWFAGGTSSIEAIEG